jgi:peptidyl-prolyl cis-trans isomerase SDCCAG10
VTEPHTSGKVVLHTTLGALDVELWPKESPKAVRNFVQLCLEGFYDNCIFHRLIKDFIMQTGDPTGSGRVVARAFTAASLQKSFTRVCASRIVVILAMAGGPDGNLSQFFITLDKTPQLERQAHDFRQAHWQRHLQSSCPSTISRSTPMSARSFPPKIVRTEVLFNPFDDIVPRVRRRLCRADRCQCQAALPMQPAPQRLRLQQSVSPIATSSRLSTTTMMMTTTTTMTKAMRSPRSRSSWCLCTKSLRQ